MKTSLKLSTSKKKVVIEVNEGIMTITLINNSGVKTKSEDITFDIMNNDIITNIITEAKKCVDQKKKTGISDEYTLVEETKDNPKELLLYDNKEESIFLCLSIFNTEKKSNFVIDIVVKDLRKLISIISDIVQVESSENL